MFVRKRRYRRELKRPKREIRIVDGRYVESLREQTERTYYQVCESYRDADGRPCQRVICTLEAKPLAEQIAELRAHKRPHPHWAKHLALLEHVHEQLGDWRP